MKPTDEWKLPGKSLPQKTHPCDHERADLLVNRARAKERPRPKDTIKAESVVAAFNTWAFKREQPDDRAGLLEQAAKAIAVSQPLRFVLYWGKGPRNAAGPKETACIDFLGQMMDRIREVYAPGARMTIVFTDTHAQLNGHKVENYVAYFRSVKALLPERGYDTCHLASIVRDARPLLGDFDPQSATLDRGLLSLLINSAEKWYRGGGTAHEGAEAYYRANLVERKAIEVSFPDCVFVTFNGSELRPLFPERLPIFYMYSLKKGFSVKPWFLA